MNAMTDLPRYGTDFSAYWEDYCRDGVVIIRGALDDPQMQRVEVAFEARLADPGPHAERIFPSDQAVTLQTVGISADDPVIIPLLEHTAIVDIAQSLLGGAPVWYMQDQLWLKEGGNARRTCWHQDASYFLADGLDSVVMWFCMDAVDKVNCLEVVRGSHRGPTYNGSLLDPEDPTEPLYEGDAFPRLPDIEADRDRWDIVSADMARGDVLVFNMNSLHGGAPTFPGQRRRTLSFRFFGPDYRFATRGRIRTDHPMAAARANQDSERLTVGYRDLSVGDPIGKSRFFKKLREAAPGWSP